MGPSDRESVGSTVNAPELCPFCGEEAFVDVFELWDERDFQLETCCEAAHDSWLESIACPVFGEETLEELAEIVGGWIPDGLRRIYVDDELARVRIDHGLRVGPISRGEAKDFVREHHRHNPPPAGDRFRFGCWNGPELIAVAIVGRPVARMIDHETTVEVNRLCVNHDLAPALTWKACSLLYGAAAEEAQDRGFSKAITYTLESESGMSLRYARWKPVATTKGGSWDRPSRRRTDKAPTCPKVRWEKTLAA